MNTIQYHNTMLIYCRTKPRWHLPTMIKAIYQTFSGLETKKLATIYNWTHMVHSYLFLFKYN